MFRLTNKKKKLKETKGASLIIWCEPGGIKWWPPPVSCITGDNRGYEGDVGKY